MPKPLQLKGHEHLAILRLSAMGDVILVVPLIVSLQRAYPALKITWIISDIFYPLVQSLQDVDFLVIKKPKTLLDYWRLRKRLKPYRFDVLLAIQASLRVNIITALINARHKIGYDKKRARDLQGLFINRRIPFARQHLLDSFLAFLSPLGIKKKSIDWPLCWPEKDRAWAAAFREPHKKLIVLHPCASKPERNASAAFYIALCQALNEQKKCDASLKWWPFAGRAGDVACHLSGTALC